MTEEKAKDILDFIASKSCVFYNRFRCNKFSIKKEYNGNKYLIVVVTCESAFNLYAVNKKNVKALTYSKRLENMSMHILNELLKYTEKGYSIETCYEGDMILPAYATLEQLEIMMDLDNENDK